MRTKGHKCYNIKCGACVCKTLCGLSGDEALTCEDRMVNQKTNADRIRTMNDEELAELLVYESVEYTVDYDYDENPIDDYTPCWRTSDGSIFWGYEEAVEFELAWLQQPAKEDA